MFRAGVGLAQIYPIRVPLKGFQGDIGYIGIGV